MVQVYQLQRTGLLKATRNYMSVLLDKVVVVLLIDHQLDVYRCAKYTVKYELISVSSIS